jgi:hypothetical protein
MPCEVVLYRVVVFKMAAIAMETTKMLNQQLPHTTVDIPTKFHEV